MNIAFYNGMLLQVTLHDSKATILSKRIVGADTIDFYNYFERTTRKTCTTPNTNTCSSTITGNSTICVDIWRIHRHKHRSCKMPMTPGTNGHVLNTSRLAASPTTCSG